MIFVEQKMYNQPLPTNNPTTSVKDSYVQVTLRKTSEQKRRN